MNLRRLNLEFRLQHKDLTHIYAHNCPYNLQNFAASSQRLGIARRMTTETPIQSPTTKLKPLE